VKQFPISFAETSLALDVPAAEPATTSLHTKGYEVRTGLTKAYAEVIIAMALEPGIKEYCPNDSGSRFQSMTAVEAWLRKGREVFLLIETSSQTLAGYAWAGLAADSHVADGKTTFALRISEAHQGKGLATPYAQAVLIGAQAMFDVTNVWLEAWQSNAGAVHVYKKLGFEQVAHEIADRPTIHAGMVKDERLYMKLPSTFVKDDES
jgi:RimJ/RimL family protein N-acetyltransferase